MSTKLDQDRANRKLGIALALLALAFGAVFAVKIIFLSSH
jgi:hypothetical protein